MASPRILQLFKRSRTQPLPSHKSLHANIRSARSSLSRSSILPRAFPPLSAGFTRRCISTHTGGEFAPEESFKEDIVISDADPAAEVVSSVIPPLQYGDLASAGLVNWGPTGVFVWSLEALNVSTGLSWFWTIVGGTVLWRIVLLPFHIKRLRQFSLSYHFVNDVVIRETGRMLKADATLNELVTELQPHSVHWFNARGLHPPSLALNFLMSFPPLYGGFVGLLKMCYLPVAQLSAEGLIATPEGYFFPALAFGLLQMQLVVSRRLLSPIGAGTSVGPLRTGFLIVHAMSASALLLLPSLPIASLVQICAFSITGMLRSWIFTLPKVREYFGILPQLSVKDVRPLFPEEDEWQDDKVKRKGNEK